MGEETTSVLHLNVTVLGEMLGKSVVGQLASLGRPYILLRLSTRTCPLSTRGSSLY
jgi:hypothetical protein